MERALILGSLACVSSALIALLTLAIRAEGFDFPLINALLAGEIGEFLAGLLLLAIYLTAFVVVGLLVAMPTAFPFIAIMARFELKASILRKIWVWGFLGAACAVPLGLWMAWPSPLYESDGSARWNLGFLWVNLGSGFIGGVAAWFGFYRPIKSDL